MTVHCLNNFQCDGNRQAHGSAGRACGTVFENEERTSCSTEGLSSAPPGRLDALCRDAFAQGQPIVGISTVTTYSADARITAVDPANRTVSLAFTSGATAVRQVSPSVANFAQTKVGDMVSLGFEDRLTFVLSGPNTKTPRDRDTTVRRWPPAQGHERRGRLGRPGGRQLVGHRRQSDGRHDLAGQSGRRRDPHLPSARRRAAHSCRASSRATPDGDQQAWRSSRSRRSKVDQACRCTRRRRRISRRCRAATTACRDTCVGATQIERQRAARHTAARRSGVVRAARRLGQAQAAADGAGRIDHQRNRQAAAGRMNDPAE